MSRALSPLLALTLLSTATVADARSGTATKYRAANMFGGYTDKVVEPGVWRVNARANGIAERGFAMNMAAYRAADLVRQAGYEFMQVINQKGKETYRTRSSGSHASLGQTMTLWVRGANTAAAPADCRAEAPALCFTVSVARAMDRIRPLLTFPDDGT